jgi:hypothetical protein
LSRGEHENTNHLKQLLILQQRRPAGRMLMTRPAEQKSKSALVSTPCGAARRRMTASYNSVPLLERHHLFPMLAHKFARLRRSLLPHAVRDRTPVLHRRIHRVQ